MSSQMSILSPDTRLQAFHIPPTLIEFKARIDKTTVGNPEKLDFQDLYYLFAHMLRSLAPQDPRYGNAYATTPSLLYKKLSQNPDYAWITRSPDIMKLFFLVTQGANESLLGKSQQVIKNRALLEEVIYNVSYDYIKDAAKDLQKTTAIKAIKDFSTQDVNSYISFFCWLPKELKLDPDVIQVILAINKDNPSLQQYTEERIGDLIGATLTFEELGKNLEFYAPYPHLLKKILNKNPESSKLFKDNRYLSIVFTICPRPLFCLDGLLQPQNESHKKAVLGHLRTDSKDPWPHAAIFLNPQDAKERELFLKLIQEFPPVFYENNQHLLGHIRNIDEAMLKQICTGLCTKDPRWLTVDFIRNKVALSEDFFRPLIEKDPGSVLSALRAIKKEFRPTRTILFSLIEKRVDFDSLRELLEETVSKNDIPMFNAIINNYCDTTTFIKINSIIDFMGGKIDSTTLPLNFFDLLSPRLSDLLKNFTRSLNSEKDNGKEIRSRDYWNKPFIKSVRKTGGDSMVVNAALWGFFPFVEDLLPHNPRMTLNDLLPLASQSFHLLPKQLKETIYFQHVYSLPAGDLKDMLVLNSIQSGVDVPIQLVTTKEQVYAWLKYDGSRLPLLYNHTLQNSTNSFWQSFLRDPNVITHAFSNTLYIERYFNAYATFGQGKLFSFKQPESIEEAENPDHALLKYLRDLAPPEPPALFDFNTVLSLLKPHLKLDKDPLVGPDDIVQGPDSSGYESKTSKTSQV